MLRGLLVRINKWVRHRRVYNTEEATRDSFENIPRPIGNDMLISQQPVLRGVIVVGEKKYSLRIVEFFTSHYIGVETYSMEHIPSEQNKILEICRLFKFCSHLVVVTLGNVGDIAFFVDVVVRDIKCPETVLILDNTTYPPHFPFSCKFLYYQNKLMKSQHSNVTQHGESHKIATFWSQYHTCKLTNTILGCLDSMELRASMWNIVQYANRHIPECRTELHTNGDEDIRSWYFLLA